MNFVFNEGRPDGDSQTQCPDVVSEYAGSEGQSMDTQTGPLSLAQTTHLNEHILGSQLSFALVCETIRPLEAGRASQPFREKIGGVAF